MLAATERVNLAGAARGRGGLERERVLVAAADVGELVATVKRNLFGHLLRLAVAVTALPVFAGAPAVHQAGSYARGEEEE